MYLELSNLNGSHIGFGKGTYAYVKDNILYLHGNVNFEKLMIELSYRAKKEKTCHYCGRKFSKNVVRTIDHCYPKLYGGPTIMNNLVACCSECNQEKSDLTEDEYVNWLRIEDCVERKKFRLKCMGRSEKKRITKGTIIPKEWFRKGKKNNIITTFDFSQQVKGKRYEAEKEFFYKYGHLSNAIIVSNEGVLLDGFMSLWVAKEEGYNDYKIIQLANVQMECK